MDISFVLAGIIGIVIIASTMGGMAVLEKRNNHNEMISLLVKVFGVVAVILTLVAVRVESMPTEKVSSVTPETSETSETTDDTADISERIIKIGVLEEPPQVSNPDWYEGNTAAIEAAFENRPTVVIDGEKYQVELVSNRDLPSYSEEPFSGVSHYQEAADYFSMNECAAVIASYCTESALMPVAEMGIPVFVTDSPHGFDGHGMVFVLDQTEENFADLQAQFILNQIPGTANSNQLLVLYDEQQPDPTVSIEERDRFIAAFEAYGGEVVYASVSDRDQIETALESAIAAGEYNMIYAGLLYGNVMPEDVLIVRDKLIEELAEPGTGTSIVPVIVERNDQQMLNQYANTYNLQQSFNPDISSAIREKTGNNGVSESWVQLYSAYDIILDTLEVTEEKEELATMVKTGVFFESGAHGNVTFAGGTQAFYDSISAGHQIIGGHEPEYMTYSADIYALYDKYSVE